MVAATGFSSLCYTFYISRLDWKDEARQARERTAEGAAAEDDGVDGVDDGSDGDCDDGDRARVESNASNGFFDHRAYAAFEDDMSELDGDGGGGGSDGVDGGGGGDFDDGVALARRP
jgi:hypothetical protein